MKNFYHLHIDKVLTAFHIKERFDCEQLNELLTTNDTLSAFEDATLDLDRCWNEEELKMKFISLLFDLAYY